jgi:class 3 adenylate cyclase
VTGADVTLADLSRFLGTLTIGETGRAMIIDRDGRVIAAPRAEQLLRDSAAKPGAIRIDQIGDAAAAAAYDRFRVEGPGTQTVPVDGRRYLATLTPVSTLASLHSKWGILIVVPEDEFVGFVDRNSRTALVMSLVIVALAALLAALLVRQGLRTDRAERLFRGRSHAITRQSEALSRLAGDPDLFDPSQNRFAEALTEAAAEITGAKRASLWYFSHSDRLLYCADSYQTDPPVHASGMELERSELREFFDHLSSGAVIETDDATRYPHTSAMHRLMMAPVGTQSLLSIPVQRQTRTIGAIWVEDALDTIGSRQSLRILACIAALRAPDIVAEPQNQIYPDLPLPSSTTPLEETAIVRNSSAELAARGLDADTLGDALFPEVSVFVLRIEDGAAAIAGRAIEPELVDSIACTVQSIAAEQEVSYLKVVGCDIVGAAGFSTGDTTAPARVANTAIAGRDRLAALFEAKGLTPEFRIGIDCGAGIGSTIGQSPQVFNLWGEAVRTAQTMAATAVPGAIQASEAAYERLRDQFRFRPRGTFYLPHTGTARTFLLGGRL